MPPSLSYFCFVIDMTDGDLCNELSTDLSSLIFLAADRPSHGSQARVCYGY